MDTDQDGVCDELEVVGCTDPTACNFNALATDDDGTCTGIVDLCGFVAATIRHVLDALTQWHATTTPQRFGNPRKP